MLMDSFEVENFRSLKHLKLEKLARVNLLVGKNNSGKTSVLEGFAALASIEQEWWLSIAEKERGLENTKADFRYLFYGFDTSITISFKAFYRTEDIATSSEKSFMYAFVKVPDRQAINTIKEKEVTAVQRIRHSNARKSATDNTLLVSVSTSLSQASADWNVTRDNDDEYFLTPLSDEAEDVLASGIEFPGSERHNASEMITTTIDRNTLSKKIELLKVNKEDESFLRIMRQIEPRMNSIDLGAGGQIYLDLGKEFRTLLPLNLMGEGIQRLLDIISGISYVTGGVVLIDEIDNGLHYSALRILWKGILQAAREYDVQIVATTHSAEALHHLTWVLDDEEYKDYRDDVAAYTLIRAKDDTVRSYRYDYEQLDFAMEHDIEVRN